PRPRGTDARRLTPGPTASGQPGVGRFHETPGGAAGGPLDGTTAGELASPAMRRSGSTRRTGPAGRTGRTGRTRLRVTAAAVCAAAVAALTAVPAQAHGPERHTAPHWSLKDT